jgi:hypothetical protein
MTSALARPSFTLFSPPRTAQGASAHTHTFGGAAPVPVAQCRTEALGCTCTHPRARSHDARLTRLASPPRSRGIDRVRPPGCTSRRRARHGAWSSRPKARRWLRAGVRSAKSRARTHVPGTVARRISLVAGGAARCGRRNEARLPALSLHVLARVEVRCTQTSSSSPDDGELQGYRRPRSFTPSWNGSSAARRPASRQEFKVACLDAIDASQERGHDGGKW